MVFAPSSPPPGSPDPALRPGGSEAAPGPVTRVLHAMGVEPSAESPKSRQLFTPEYYEGVARRTHALLRVRTQWAAAALAGLALLVLGGVELAGRLAGSAATGATPPPAGGAGTIFWSAWGLALLSCVVGGAVGAGVRLRTRGLVNASLAMLIAFGGLQAIAWTAGRGSPDAAALHAGLGAAIACAALPWTFPQATRALASIAVILGLCVGVFTPGSPGVRVAMGLLYPLGVLPAALIAWARAGWSTDRSRLDFLKSHFGEVRRELLDARRLHEALFPPFFSDPVVEFTYTYEPMSQIGGDFLHIHRESRPGPDGADEPWRTSVAIIDVTGHGVAAALTVNRLHGELQRIFGERPDTPPGEVIRLLNRYVNLTLSTHSVFVTAACFRVSADASVLEYCNAGHPPAFLRTIDGKLQTLDSTTFMLGVCDDSQFDAEVASSPFAPGDALIAYTDGAVESRNRDGKMMGVDGLMKVLTYAQRAEKGGWARNVLDAVVWYRHGPPADDTLVIELRRPSRPRGRRSVPADPRAGAPSSASPA